MRIAVLLSVLCCGVLAAATTTKQPTFFGRRDYPSYAPSVAVADVNGDKIPDMIVVAGDSIQTWFGNGLGAFSAGPTTVTQQALYGVSQADLNGDGEIDLVVTTAGGFGVCFGNGDGTFQQPVFYGIGSGYGTTHAALGDFNGDGILDAVEGGDSGLWLFTGQGGAYSVPPRF